MTYLRKSALASALLLSTSVIAAHAADVTFQRLLNAKNEPQNWLLTYGTYDAYRQSGLSQINRANVGNLQLKYMVGLGTPSGAGVPLGQSTPLVDEGLMYVTTGRGEVIKIDVRNSSRGTVLWRFDPKIEGTYLRNRGVALLGKGVYLTTSDAPRMFKLDRDSGETAWEIKTGDTADKMELQKSTASPLAVKDKIVIGQSNGDGGTRGWVAAFNAETGDLAWRFHVIPTPGEPGHETWKDDHDAWMTGGGAIWATPSYDAETNTLYVGTGNPVPFYDPQWHPGDNLYTNSALALDADTGKLKWYFQETPNESWDYDTTNMRLLYDIDVGGQTRKVAGNFSRDGFFYTLDRVNGAFLFANPYTTVTWTKGLDPKTGKPVEYDPNVALQDYAGASIRYGKKDTTGRNVCPNFAGAPTYMPPTYDPSRRVAYVSGSESCADFYNTRAGDAATKVLGAGASPSRAAPIGYIKGVDVQTGKLVHEIHTQYPIYSGLLGTAGDLLFVGHLDGKFSAYDKDTLTELWSYNSGIDLGAPAISYSVDGKQYVAITTGGRARALIDPQFYKELDLVMSGVSVLLVFGL